MENPPPTSCQKWSVCPSSHTKNLSAPGPSPFWNFSPFWGFISVAFGHLQGAILNAPQEEMLFTMEMRSSKEQIVLRHKKKCYYTWTILSFWPFAGQLVGPPPQVAKNGPFAQRPYNGFTNAVTGSILEFLALWAFISVAFGHLQRAILHAPQEETLLNMDHAHRPDGISYHVVQQPSFLTLIC